MKRVIDGKRYDTEAAELIAEASASCPCSDFGYWEEALYKTRNGQFFVAGEGGPMTRWSRAIDTNSRSGGNGIDLLTAAEALAWCEQHQVDADTIAEHFEIEEG